MESIVIVLAYAIVAAIGYAWRDRSIDGSNVSLCLTCVNAVVTRGSGGQELIACNLGGGLRPIVFVVCECSGFSSRLVTITPVRIEGFIREESEVYAEIRIS